MRTMSKKAAIVAAALAITLLSACSHTKEFDAINARIGSVEKSASDAMGAANRAQSSADAAAAAAAESQKTANDAVEAVSRMAEKCCRK